MEPDAQPHVTAGRIGRVDRRCSRGADDGDGEAGDPGRVIRLPAGLCVTYWLLCAGFSTSHPSPDPPTARTLHPRSIQFGPAPQPHPIPPPNEPTNAPTRYLLFDQVRHPHPRVPDRLYLRQQLQRKAHCQCVREVRAGAAANDAGLISGCPIDFLIQALPRVLLKTSEFRTNQPPVAGVFTVHRFSTRHCGFIRVAVARVCRQSDLENAVGHRQVVELCVEAVEH